MTEHPALTQRHIYGIIIAKRRCFIMMMTMPKIRPVSDLRNHYGELMEDIHESNEPVFLTKNGKGDAVLMSTNSGTLKSILNSRNPRRKKSATPNATPTKR
jgi:prevent-host-death family protein